MSHPYRPFPRSNIPLVGQAFTVKNGFATVMIQCGCGANEPVLIVGDAQAPCGACGRVYAQMEFTYSRQTGQINAAIGIAQGSHAADQKPAGVPS